MPHLLESNMPRKPQDTQPYPYKFKKSKFVFDAKRMELVAGKLPTKDGQLWKGETTEGGKMEFAGNSDGDPTPYWGWS